jgi:hypothetical protein
VIVCTPAADPIVTAKFEAILTPKTEKSLFRIGVCATVNALEKTNTSAAVGSIPPSHEAPALRSVEP